MALNQVYEDGPLQLVCSNPATPASGDPVTFGQMAGVALTAEDAVTGRTTVAFEGVFNLSVKGENNAGNSPVAVGDRLYYEAGQTPPVNKDNVAGIFIGFALATVTSGATATIPVKLAGSH